MAVPPLAQRRSYALSAEEIAAEQAYFRQLLPPLHSAAAAAPLQLANYIDGRFVPTAAGQATIASMNPATNEVQAALWRPMCSHSPILEKLCSCFFTRCTPCSRTAMRPKWTRLSRLPSAPFQGTLTVKRRPAQDKGSLDTKTFLYATKPSLFYFRFFISWAALSRQERADYLNAVADMIERNLETFAIAESRDQGEREKFSVYTISSPMYQRLAYDFRRSGRQAHPLGPRS